MIVIDHMTLDVSLIYGFPKNTNRALATRDHVFQLLNRGELLCFFDLRLWDVPSQNSQDLLWDLNPCVYFAIAAFFCGAEKIIPMLVFDSREYLLNLDFPDECLSSSYQAKYMKLLIV